MPHLRLQCPQEWLHPEFIASKGFDPARLLERLVQVVASLKMENPASEPPLVPFINLNNLKHAIEPQYHAHVGGDSCKSFLHVTLAAGNDTPGRTAAVRKMVAETLGNEIDAFLAAIPNHESLGIASVTVWVQDIDRDRGYTTTAERAKKRRTS